MQQWRTAVTGRVLFACSQVQAVERRQEVEKHKTEEKKAEEQRAAAAAKDRIARARVVASAKEAQAWLLCSAPGISSSVYFWLLHEMQRPNVTVFQAAARVPSPTVPGHQPQAVPPAMYCRWQLYSRS